ncbi:hypothetical protein GCM10010218_56570 [Streptomyces mashuensis]|uniref:HTH cro/C1-type domain-containing protein n=1 Tax=Streptomyces mashuensis TaxID=33904 RepID=A0A919B9P0_9ACTN|nr:helix-turn-helix transcriptional regulator [Streptomyces mashuensis]GHF67762.1 hypothetical protein GCM10010218_56570 [Streptomyces mashuensis]
MADPSLSTCPVCARRFPQTPGPGRRKVYCCPACRRRAQRVRDGRAEPPAAHSSRPLALRLAEDLQRCAARLLEAEHAGRDLAVLLRAADELMGEVECYKAAAVHDARLRGAGWRDVSRAACVSEVTARQRWGEAAIRRRLQRRDAERAAQAAGEDIPAAWEAAAGREELTGDPAARRLAAVLSELRRRSGLTLRDVATGNDLSPSYVSRILAGERLPTWPVVRTLATALGGDPAELRVLWEAGHGLAPAPRDSIDAAAGRLRAALRGLYLAAGSPPYAELCRAAGDRLTGDAVHDLLHGATVPEWESTSLLVSALGGLPAEIRPLWEAFHYGFLATIDGPPAGG